MEIDKVKFDKAIEKLEQSIHSSSFAIEQIRCLGNDPQIKARIEREEYRLENLKEIYQLFLSVRNDS